MAAQLLDEGSHVRGLVLDGDPAAARIPEDVDVYIGDVTDKDSLERFFSVDEKHRGYRNPLCGYCDC